MKAEPSITWMKLKKEDGIQVGVKTDSGIKVSRKFHLHTEYICVNEVKKISLDILKQVEDKEHVIMVRGYSNVFVN